MNETAYLILENGQVFPAKRFGAAGETIGELVFTTAMTGYLETITDPNYYGHIVVQTFPLIGNYGVIPADIEGARPWLRAYIVREWCERPSNFRSEGDLDSYLKKEGVIGLYDIDTRQLTKIVREFGACNAMIADDTDNMQQKLKQIRAYRITDAVREMYELAPQHDQDTGPQSVGTKKVALLNFGDKSSIQKSLEKRGCSVRVFDAFSAADQILDYAPDGIVLSDGPGDPAVNTTIISEISKVCESRIPIFGIGLGHQLLALSQGAKTEKLKHGHRGANQPVRDTTTGRVYITSQNHGYVVASSALPQNACESYVNVNDGTCEGINYLYMPAFSVQFNPEPPAGPSDTSLLFDRFATLMDEYRKGGASNA